MRPDYKYTIEPNYGHDFDQEWNEESWCPLNEVQCVSIIMEVIMVIVLQIILIKDESSSVI